MKNLQNIKFAFFPTGISESVPHTTVLTEDSSGLIQLPPVAGEVIKSSCLDKLPVKLDGKGVSVFWIENELFNSIMTQPLSTTLLLSPAEGNVHQIWLIGDNELLLCLKKHFLKLKFVKEEEIYFHVKNKEDSLYELRRLPFGIRLSKRNAEALIVFN